VGSKFKLDWGIHGLLKFTVESEGDILDIGSGAGEHKRFLEYQGRKVFSVDYDKSADYEGDILEMDLGRIFPSIWCSHVLEHQRNVGAFLDRLYNLLDDGGTLGIVVPLHDRDRMIAGHITSWSIGLLLYNLILAGFDCSQAKVLYSYELSIVLKKSPLEKNPNHKNSIIGDEGVDPFKSYSSAFPIQISQGSTIKGPGGINWGEAVPNMPNSCELISSNLPKVVNVNGYNNLRRTSDSG